MEKTNIPDELASLDAYWSQRVLGEANGTLIKVAKGVGATTWHRHDDQDEVFVGYSGRLTVQLRTGDVELGEGDMLVVPRGVEHCPTADEPVHFLVLGTGVTSTREGGRPDWSFG